MRKAYGDNNRPRGNRALGGVLVAVVVGMVGAAYAAVPLYDLFCRVTGYGGTTQVATSAPDQVLDRKMTVRFNADVQSKMSWSFAPAQIELSVRVGESALAFYKVKNLSDHAVVGTATFNVTPQKAGIYFNKIDCFCFTEQLLQAGQEADMPVTFYIDPAIVDDPGMRDVTTITLSYMFFDAGPEALDQLLGAMTEESKSAEGRS